MLIEKKNMKLVSHKLFYKTISYRIVDMFRTEIDCGLVVDFK